MTDYVDSLSKGDEKGILYFVLSVASAMKTEWQRKPDFLEFGAGRMDPWSGRNFESAGYAKT